MTRTGDREIPFVSERIPGNPGELARVRVQFTICLKLFEMTVKKCFFSPMITCVTVFLSFRNFSMNKTLGLKLSVYSRFNS